MSRFLLVNNDNVLYEKISRFFHNKGHEVETVQTSHSAADMLEKNIFDIILFDTTVTDIKAEDFVTLARKINSNTIVIIAVESETTDETIQAMNNGAYDFIQKPFNFPELEIRVNRAINLRSLRQEADSLRGERNIIYKTENFIGESPEIKKVFEILNKVAKSNATVLLTGETGTGKELVAGATHYNSFRAGRAFVRVNCAALPEYLLESELFGHEKGAFTGADKQRIGRFEQADGGSIFLDEVGDMSLTTQAKVLRVIEEKEFERVGSSKTIKVDIRIITATNKDLVKEIEEGNFREDLFYRLNVVNIYIPPLRVRKGDIILLTYFFLKKLCGDLKKRLKELHPLTIKHLTEYPWPGNTRELENTIERAVIMAEGDIIIPEDLGLPIKSEYMKSEQNSIKIPAGGIRLDEVEKELVLQALKVCDWVQKDAASLLGISTRVLNYKIKRFGITHQQWKKNK
ncbi:Regulatory protein AtoC [subsurface metagenome]